MISDLKAIEENDILITFKVNDVEDSLNYSTFSKYWSYSNAEDVEDFHIYIASENELAGYMTTASGQGGIAFIYDVVDKKVTHISNAEYVIFINISGDYLYILSDIHYYGKRSTIAVYRSKLGTLDAWYSDELKTNIPEDLLRSASHKNGIESFWVKETKIFLRRNGQIEEYEIVY